MQKRFLILTFALALVFSLSACGNKADNDSNSKDNTKVEKPAKGQKTDKEKSNSTNSTSENKNDSAINDSNYDQQVNSQTTPTNSSNPTENNDNTDTVQNTPAVSNKINTNDEAVECAKQQLGYANNDDIIGGAETNSENGQTFYAVQLKSLSAVLKHGAGGTVGYYKVYPNGTLTTLIPTQAPISEEQND